MTTGAQRGGVYCISKGDRHYIGSSVNVARRMGDHRSALRRGKHHSRHLQRAWDKYGEKAFEFSVLEPVICETEILPREQVYLDKFAPFYNGAKVAGSQLGFRHSAEARAKMSETRKGRVRSTESIARQKAAQTGRVMSDETKAKLSAAHMGRTFTPEHRANISATHRRYQTPETRVKMAVSQQRRRALEMRAAGLEVPAFIDGEVIKP